MDDVIQISKINDFTFCPYSIYLHGVYESFESDMYHDTAQKTGKIEHETIEKGTYSSASRYLQGIPIFSQKYNIVGKIDIYDQTDHHLIERKYQLKQVFDGHRFQLYAQMVCLEEMGHPVARLSIHSLADNKRLSIPLPDQEETNRFERVLSAMREFQPTCDPGSHSEAKCAHCIYHELCGYTVC